MELQVFFDRIDRLYRIGDVISGSVVLQPDSDRSYSDIRVTYRWRTHGQGNRDQGAEEALSLAAEMTTLTSGERRRFPFRFEAPNGPVTYHGQYLNVDWYLTGHAKCGPLHHLKCERDFLLLGCERGRPAVAASDRTPEEDHPASSIGAADRRQGLMEVGTVSPEPLEWLKLPYLLYAVIGLCAFVVFTSLAWSVVASLAVSAAIAVGIGLIVEAILRNSYKLKLELGDVWVRPAGVYRGSDVCCHLDLVAKRRVHLSCITASITLRERVKESDGTTTVTKTYVVDEKRCTRTFDEDLYEGRRIVFDCALPVGPNAPPSFSSKNNDLEWTITMKAELKGWPGWSRSFDLTVSP